MALKLRKAIKSAVRRIRRPLLRHARRHGLILMYHRIAVERQDPWDLCVSPANFSEQLDVLARTAEVVPLREFTQRLKSARSKRPTVAITFDDGYVDNFAAALPLLKKFNAPATIFIATDWIGRPEPFWWDLLSALALEAPLPGEIHLRLGRSDFHWKNNSAETDRRTLHHDLWSRLQVAQEAERNAALRTLCELTGFDVARVSAARAMTPDELLSVRDSGLVELGAHTMSHSPLPALSPDEQHREIMGSKLGCEKLLGCTPSSFAYPYGELNATSRAVVADCGFERACTSNADLAWAGGDALLLPRFVAPNLSGEAFARRLRDSWLA